MKQWDLISAACSKAVDSHSFIPGAELIHWQGREVFYAVADGVPAFNQGESHFPADVGDPLGSYMVWGRPTGSTGQRETD